MLKIRLKPEEKILINGSVLSNGESTNVTLILHNEAPVILRETDIMSRLPDAPNVFQHLYFLIQEVYIAGNKTLRIELLDELSMLIEMFPEDLPYVTIKKFVELDKMYPAIRELKRWKGECIS